MLLWERWHTTQIQALTAITKKNDLHCLGRRHCLCWSGEIVLNLRDMEQRKGTPSSTKENPWRVFHHHYRFCQGGRQRSGAWELRGGLFWEGHRTSANALCAQSLQKSTWKFFGQFLEFLNSIVHTHALKGCCGQLLDLKLWPRFQELTNSLRHRNSFMDSISEVVSQQLAWRAQRERWPREGITLFAAFCVLCFLLTLAAWQFS